MLIAACIPQDHSLHAETLSDVNTSTTFYLYSHLEYIDTDNYLASGPLNGFIGCLESVTEERNAGVTDKRYFLSIEGKKRYYYSIRTIKEQIVRISPMRKADIGFKGGGAMYRAACDLRLLLQTPNE